MKVTKFTSKKNLHPTDRELANFIDNKLTSKKREKFLEHLIYCNECINIAIFSIKKIKKKY